MAPPSPGGLRPVDRPAFDCRQAVPDRETRPSFGPIQVLRERESSWSGRTWPICVAGSSIASLETRSTAEGAETSPKVLSTKRGKFSRRCSVCYAISGNMRWWYGRPLGTSHAVWRGENPQPGLFLQEPSSISTLPWIQSHTLEVRDAT